MEIEEKIEKRWKITGGKEFWVSEEELSQVDYDLLSMPILEWIGSWENETQKKGTAPLPGKEEVK